MKLIQTFEDSLYDAVTNLYELPNGMKVVHSVDFKTVETVINIIIKSGNESDVALGLPHGTAHFLEHMLAANPNGIFKTKAALERYKLGNLKKAPMMENAYTSRDTICLHGSINSKFEHRLMKLLYSYLIYPTELFSKYIEKERKIILAERQGKDKTEEDDGYNFFKQIMTFKDIKLYHNGLGEVEDINRITVSDLEKLFKSVLSKNNVIVSIQSNEAISKKVIDYLHLIDDLLQSNNQSKYQLKEDEVKNRKNIGAFKRQQNQGVTIELGYFEKEEKDIKYKERAGFSIINSLIWKVSFESLREKLGLIYKVDVGTSKYQLTGNRMRYISYVTDLKNLKKLITKVDKLLNKDIFKFAKSQKGKEWFSSMQSGFLYPFTKNYDRDFAADIAYGILLDFPILDINTLIQTYKEITIEEVLDLYKTQYLPKEKYIWIVSDQEKETILKKIKYQNF